MTVSLTDTGWIGDNTGTWTTGNDVVSNLNLGDPVGIQVDGGVTSNALAGDDSITGTGLGRGIDNNGGTISTGNGDDSIIGKATGFPVHGIINFSRMSTFGIDNNGGTIVTGEGNDSITGTGDIGIYNSGTIATGVGNDTVTANGKFGGDGSVFLGRGDDILSGFGTGKFYGGKGTDTLILPLGSYSVGSITIDNNTFVTFTLDGLTMNTTGFEFLNIGATSYDFSNLPSIVS